ncbi:hypothetical protein [Empedobacter stercoris]|uniref:hypothetical protein n=1 Tax=Empedobacter stercoris TaxID=1628248 RepID=UPI001CE0BF75|nr:hypothetical protein [Empedobacter stercoris]MCA4782266.1 hypothetical protein [Empedobacter stercoris]
MYKNQYILTICTVLGFLYTLFFYNQNTKLENIATLKAYSVIEQGCKKSKGGSSVHIKYNNKIYYIRLSIATCEKYPIGSKIMLNYNDQFDYFYMPDGLKRDKNRLLIISGIFILSIIPWKKIIKR